MQIIKTYQNSEKHKITLEPDPVPEPDLKPEPEPKPDDQEPPANDLEKGFVVGYIITGDGKPTVNDAILILRHVAGIIDIGEKYGSDAFKRAHVNGAEKISVKGAILILRAIVGL